MKNTLWVKRIVLLNGEPVGKGRPGRDEKKSRTCLYIPLKESFGSHSRATRESPYNPSKNDAQRKQFKRTNISNLVPVNPEAEAVAVNPEPVAEAVTA